MKRRYLLLPIVLAVLLGAWLARERLSEPLIKSTLHSYGLSDPAVDVDELGLSRSRLSRLGFTLTTDSGHLRLVIEDAVIEYSPGHLAAGRIEGLNIERLLIEFTGASASMEAARAPIQALEPIAIIAGLRNALREYIVFDSFSVQRLVLSGEVFGPLQRTPLRLAGTNDNGNTQAELTLLDTEGAEQADNLSRLSIKQLSENHLVAELGLSAQPSVQPAAIELTINDTSIDGKYTIEPAPLRRWLQPLSDAAFIHETARINGTVAVNLDADDHIKSRLTAQTGKMDIADYRASNVFVDLMLKMPQAYPVRSITVEQDSTIMAERFSSGEFSLPNTRLGARGELSIAGNTWRYEGALSTEKLAVNYAAYTLPLADVAAQVSADAEAVAVEGSFSPANLPGRFAYEIGHSLSSRSGKLSITPLEPIDLDARDYTLSRLLSRWPYTFNLLAGSIRLTAHGAWSPRHAPELTAVIALDDAGGSHGALVFSGLSTEHEFELLPRLHSARSSRIVLKQLDSGVVASNISTRLALQTADSGPLPQLVIRGLRGDILGGTFTGDHIVLDLNASSNSFEIKAADIDLAKIVETQQLEDIEVSGRVDGTIPVEISDKGIFIKHGAFINKVRAGTIRYNPAAGSEQLKQNPITGIALDALRDFRYSHLSADVNYTPEGMLTINLQLRGTSPELETRRPVHLNINTEQNLLSLLKSLRYAEGISAKIDKKVRRQYEKPPNNKPAE